MTNIDKDKLSLETLATLIEMYPNDMEISQLICKFHMEEKDKKHYKRILQLILDTPDDLKLGERIRRYYKNHIK